MRRLFTRAALFLLFAPALSSQVRFHGIPPSVTSITPAGFGHHGSFGGQVFVNGGFGFGHHPRFHVFFGTPFFPHRHFFFRHRAFFPTVIAPFPVYAGSIYPYARDYPEVAQSAPLAYDSGANDALAREVDRLREEVDRLREERYERDRPAPQARIQEIPPAEVPATVLVFRDGHRLETRNYAIAGQTLWIFSEQRATKRPLSALDLEATRAANEERGVEFHVGRR